MANTEVPNLSAASTLDGTESLHLVQGGNSRRSTTKAIFEAASGMDASELATFFGVLDTLGAISAAALSDKLVAYDASEATSGILTVQKLLNAVNLLGALATVDASADFILGYDTDQTVAVKIALSKIGVLNAENQALTGGAAVTSKDLGTVTTGTLTLDMGDRPLQHYTNGGAHTLAPGSVNGACIVDITNDGSAGAITVSGWTNTVGDSFTTTNGDKFRCHCSVGNAGSLLVVQAMQ